MENYGKLWNRKCRENAGMYGIKAKSLNIVYKHTYKLILLRHSLCPIDINIVNKRIADCLARDLMYMKINKNESAYQYRMRC